MIQIVNNFLKSFFFVLFSIFLLTSKSFAVIEPEDPDSTANGPVANPEQAKVVEFFQEKAVIKEHRVNAASGLADPSLDNATFYHDKPNGGVKAIIELESDLAQYNYVVQKYRKVGAAGVSFTEKIGPAYTNGFLISERAFRGLRSSDYLKAFPAVYDSELAEDANDVVIDNIFRNANNLLSYIKGTNGTPLTTFIPPAAAQRGVIDFEYQDELHYMPTTIGWIVFREKKSCYQEDPNSPYFEKIYRCDLENREQGIANNEESAIANGCEKVCEQTRCEKLYYVDGVYPIRYNLNAIMDEYTAKKRINEFKTMESFLEGSLATLEIAPFGSVIRTLMEPHFQPAWEKKALTFAKGRDVTIDILLDALPFIAQYKSASKFSKRVWMVGTAATLANAIYNNPDVLNKGADYKSIIQFLAMALTGTDVFRKFDRAGNAINTFDDVVEDLRNVEVFNNNNVLRDMAEEGADAAPILKSDIALDIKKGTDFSSPTNPDDFYFKFKNISREVKNIIEGFLSSYRALINKSENAVRLIWTDTTNARQVLDEMLEGLKDYARSREVDLRIFDWNKLAKDNPALNIQIPNYSIETQAERIIAMMQDLDPLGNINKFDLANATYTLTVKANDEFLTYLRSVNLDFPTSNYYQVASESNAILSMMSPQLNKADELLEAVRRLDPNLANDPKLTKVINDFNEALDKSNLMTRHEEIHHGIINTNVGNSDLPKLGDSYANNFARATSGTAEYIEFRKFIEKTEPDDLGRMLEGISDSLNPKTYMKKGDANNIPLTNLEFKEELLNYTRGSEMEYYIFASNHSGQDLGIFFKLAHPERFMVDIWRNSR